MLPQSLYAGLSQCHSYNRRQGGSLDVLSPAWHGSELTWHDSELTRHDSELTWHDSHLTWHDSELTRH